MSAGSFVPSVAVPIPAQTVHHARELERRFVQHYAEKPPVRFEVEEHGEYGPRIIITIHQYPLTAFVVRTEPKSVDDAINTLVYDALAQVGLLAPIPRGMSSILGAPHQVGGSVSDANLAAAVGEDGSTYGPDNLLLRISSRSRELADSYDRAIAELQTGLEKNWTAEEYLAAAQPLKPPMEAEKAATPATFTAKIMPSHRITDNMQRAAQENRPAAFLARAVLQSFTQQRDSPRQSLGGSIASAHQTKK